MRISDWSSDVCSSDLIDGQAYSLSGQYHFGAADNIVRPFVGLGYHETNYSNAKADGAGALAGQRIGVETAKGAVATVDVDVNITPTWFARARSEEHTSELQSLMRPSYAVFCLKKKLQTQP